METQTLTKSETELETIKLLIRYAWGCENTWFITKHKKQIMPKGSRLLIVLECRKTELPIHIKENYPNLGDVVSDVDGNNLLIINVKFI